MIVRSKCPNCKKMVEHISPGGKFSCPHCMTGPYLSNKRSPAEALLPVLNPFTGMTNDDAHDRCFEIMSAFTERLPSYPLLPGMDGYDDGIPRAYTMKSMNRIERVKDKIVKWMEEAGVDPEHAWSSPVVEF